MNLVSCPKVLFSGDHRIFITSKNEPLAYDNISYTAELNNFNFEGECELSNNTLIANLSLLFIVKPEKAEEGSIVMPYFIAVIDDQKKILDLQYYHILGNFNKNTDKSSYIETAIVDTQNIQIPYKDENIKLKNKIIIGFMLDKEKLNLLN